MNTKNEMIVSTPHELKKFIFDLCGFTLEKTGLDPQTYGFYLHVAFRHQLILQQKEWQMLARQISLQPLDQDRDDQVFLQKKIESFAQKIVAEVTSAHEDNWGVKLIKTSYLHQLESARKSSERAIKLLKTEDWTQISTLSLSMLAEKEEEEAIQALVNALQAHNQYLDALFDLPFVLEDFCLHLYANKKINYQPRKTAVMLGAVLTTIQQAVDAEDSLATRGLVWSLTKAVEIVLPDLPLDASLTATIEKKLLPFIAEIIKNAKLAETEKNKVLMIDNKAPESAKTQARIEILSTMGIHFDSLETILQKTLLEPVQLCQTSLKGLQACAENTQKLFDKGDALEKTRAVKDILSGFDEAATLLSSQEELAPQWLLETCQTYQRIKDKGEHLVAKGEGVLNGMGAFYQYAKSFIPDLVLQYFASTDDLDKILKTIDSEHNPVNMDNIMVYFSFFEAMEKSKFEEPLKEKLFQSYMEEVNKIKGVSYHYSEYLALEYQIKSKEVYLDNSLDKILKQFQVVDDLTASFLEPLQAVLGINNRQKLEVFILIHRLQKLEKSFDEKNPEAAFFELIKAQEMIASFPHPGLDMFNKTWLKPAQERLLTRYKNKQLIPMLEKLIDSKDPGLISEKHRYTQLYGKLNRSEKWQDCAGSNESEWRVLKDMQGFEAFQKLAAFVPQDETLDFELKETPAMMEARSLRRTIKKSILPGADRMLDILQKSLMLQETELHQYRDLTGDEKLAALCQKKQDYIQSIHALINTLRQAIQDPDEKALQFFSDLMTGKAVGLVKEEIQAKLPALPLELLKFVWHVLPSTVENPEALTETFFGNLLNYYLKDTLPGNILNAGNAYKACLNENPSPALMQVVGDPLQPANLIPNQEQIVDLVVDKILSESKKSAMAWGADYLGQLKKSVESVAMDTLVQILPYPFLATLTLKTLKSARVQKLLSSIVQSLTKQYGHLASEKADYLRQALKSSVYPLLGIELQKTLEDSACHYVLHPEEALESDRDAFALFYLKYREICPEKANSKAAIKILFPSLLAEDALAAMEAKFEALLDSERKVGKKLAKNNLIATERELQFLIDVVDFSDPENDAFVRLAIINRLLLMVLETAKILDVDTKSKLEILAVEKITAIFEKIQAIKAETSTEEAALESSAVEDNLGHSAFFLMEGLEEEDFYKVDRNLVKKTSAFQSLDKAKNKVSALLFNHLKTNLEKLEKSVDTGLVKSNEMLKTDKEVPRLGMNLIKWDYSQSTAARKLTGLLIQTAAFISWALCWSGLVSAILAGSGFLQPLLVFLGASAAVGATATGIGAIVFGIVASLRLITKFTKEILDHRAEFNAINDSQKNPSFLARAGLNMVLVMKCFGLALLKTFFTDYVGRALGIFLALEPVNRLSEGLYSWPTEDEVMQEKTSLQILKTHVSTLKALIRQADGPKLLKVWTRIEAEMQASLQSLLDVRSTDARRIRESHSQTLTEYQTLFNQLKQQVQTLDRFEKNLEVSKVPVSEPSFEPAESESGELWVEEQKSQGLVVDITAYRLARIAAVQEAVLVPLPVQESPGFVKKLLSPLWNFLGTGEEKLDESVKEKIADEFVASSLSASSFFMVENPKAARLSSSNHLFFAKQKEGEEGGHLSPGFTP